MFHHTINGKIAHKFVQGKKR